jgi:hypothetical protein
LFALNRNHIREFNSNRKDPHWGQAQAQEGRVMKVLIYVNTSKEIGDVDHLKVFANEDAAERSRELSGLRRLLLEHALYHAGADAELFADF